jgi:hypothetical protein
LRADSAALDEASEQRVVAFCSACHVMPRAESFARDAWHHEVLQGYTFYARSGRNDLDPPAPEVAVRYFRSRAPEQVALPAILEQPHALSMESYVVEAIPRLDLPIPPAVAHLRYAPRPSDGAPRILAADMRLGQVLSLELVENRWRPAVIAQLNNPCHVEPCDLDGDGREDLLVADLGSFDPDDHDRGRVVWLRSDANQAWLAEDLLTGIGRVADVRAADFDGDGRQDVLVAEFGWHETGGLWWLQQIRDRAGAIRFEARKISSLPGAIHVPVHDFDGDGRPDFVALISQQYERVDLFLNRGEAGWQTSTLWSAPDPAFGVSGISLHDLDQDGDLDILCTNGDTFDSMSLKPSHGIQWLENQGDLHFAYHRLFDLPGAYCARAGDMDGDGDMDIVASAWLPRQTTGDVNVQHLPSLVWWEQLGPADYRMHVLEMGVLYHAALELADVDQDGDLDVALGGHLANLGQWPYWGRVWRRITPAAPRTDPP